MKASTVSVSATLCGVALATLVQLKPETTEWERQCARAYKVEGGQADESLEAYCQRQSGYPATTRHVACLAEAEDAEDIAQCRESQRSGVYR